MKSAGKSGPQGIFTITGVAALVTGGTGMRIFFLNRRSSAFGVEGGVGGIGQETFSIAPPHGRSHDDDHDDQNDQSSQAKNKPREGPILEERVSYWSGGGRVRWNGGGGGCRCSRELSARRRGD